MPYSWVHRVAVPVAWKRGMNKRMKEREIEREREREGGGVD